MGYRMLLFRRAYSRSHRRHRIDLFFNLSDRFRKIFAITFFGVWYAVEGNELSVYQFCRPHRFPINKIKAIKSCKSFLWGPALSSDKLAITFTDRSVLKLSGPMYISPKDKERFVGQLLEINPDIKINL